MPNLFNISILSLVSLYFCIHEIAHAQSSPPHPPEAQALPSASPPRHPQTNSKLNHQLTMDLSQFEIQLDLPEPQWRILSQTQLRSLSAIAIAGAFNPKQVLGLVLVETLKDMNLNDYATALMENSSLKELLIESVTEVTFKNQTALRLVYSGDEANGRFRYLAYVFISGQKGYQVVSGGPIALVDQKKLELFASAVKLNPISQDHVSKLKQNEQVDEYGLTWRLQKGIFRHSLSGLKLKTNQNWTSVAGSKLAHINQEAIAALINQDTQVHIIFFDRPCPTSEPKACQAWVRYELLKDLALTDLDETYQYNYLGEAHNFQRLSHERGLYTYLYNVQIKAGRALQTLAWTLHPKVTQDHDQNELAFAETWKDLSNGLKQISLLSTLEQSQLLLELQSLSDTKSFMRTDSSWMWGKYHHFSSGLTWQRPSGLWNLNLTSSQPNQNQDLLTISSPRYGINAQVRFLSTYQLKAKDSHQYLWNELKQQLSKTRGACSQFQQGTRQVAQVNSTWSRCTFKRVINKTPTSNESKVELAWTYQLDSFHVHGSIIHILTWGPQALYEGKAEIVCESLESAFHISPPATVVFTANKDLVDERFRYRLKALPNHGELRVRSHLNLGKAGSLVEYSTPEVSIQSFALSQMDRPQVAKLIDQLAHTATIKGQQANPAAKSPAKLMRQAIWLGDHSAEKLTWSNSVSNLQRSALLISVPPVIYGVVAVGKPQEVNNILSAQHFELLSESHP